jgi:hypothetical protein
MIKDDLFDMSTYGVVRAAVLAADEETKFQRQCLCDVVHEVQLAGLPVEQLKGLAIGAAVALSHLRDGVQASDIEAIRAAIHQIIHLASASVTLAGADETPGHYHGEYEITQTEIPL